MFQINLIILTSLLYKVRDKTFEMFQELSGKSQSSFEVKKKKKSPFRIWFGQVVKCQKVWTFDQVTSQIIMKWYLTIYLTMTTEDVKGKYRRLHSYE